jgi:hypothetical protein
MQTVETVTVVTEKTETTVAKTVLRPPADSNQHRIFVWSSPTPYAMVIDEARSFQPRR